MPAFDGAAFVVSVASRALRRQLRPLAWVILEEVALDAVVEDGRLVARTSARQIADRLGINPSTASEALRVLRDRGLISCCREKGLGGRFGLSVYQLGPVTGLSVIEPQMAVPHVASPTVPQPSVVEPSGNVPPVESPLAEAPGSAWSDRPAPRVADADLAPVVMAANPESDNGTVTGGAAPHTGRSKAAAPPLIASRQRTGQEAFDLGSVPP
jgi:DNA-binding transcriptional ArsR family regulator